MTISMAPKKNVKVLTFQTPTLLLTVLLISNLLSASAGIAFDSLEIGLDYVGNVNRNVFHEYWSPGGGINAFIGTPFYYETIDYYEERNGIRMRSYHRLDVSIRFVKRKNGRERVWTIGAYNAYNRKNPFFYFIDEERDERVVKQASLFPIIPAVSWSYSF